MSKDKVTKGNRKLEFGLIAGFLSILLIVGIIAACLTKVKTAEGTKNFTITIRSERDNFDKTIKCKSSQGTLGEYLRDMEECVWEESEYGIFITGWYDMSQDFDNQYWWSISVDNQQQTTGADSIPLEDGRDYEFTLIQGW